MSLLAHITWYEVSFVVAVYLFGIASGLTLAAKPWAQEPSRD